jgi:hypothetical protein
VKSHTVAHCVANRLLRALIFISIGEFTQAKSHTAVHCVTSLLHGAATWESTGENVMLKKLAELPAVDLN